MPFALDSSNGTVVGPGEPLLMLPSNAGDPVSVKKLPSGVAYATNSVVGVSAGPSYALETDPLVLVVPVAVAGFLRVSVNSSAGIVPQGSSLTSPDLGSDDLVVHSPSTATRALVRLAQAVPMSATPIEAFAWVIP